MTREQFDRQTWHKGMRCFMVVPGIDKRFYGTIMKVMFGAQAVGVMFDGKNFVERIACERITLTETWDCKNCAYFNEDFDPEAPCYCQYPDAPPCAAIAGQ